MLEVVVCPVTLISCWPGGTAEKSGAAEGLRARGSFPGNTVVEMHSGFKSLHVTRYLPEHCPGE